MAQAVGNSSREEYWRSPNPEIMRLVTPLTPTRPCWNCGADYSPGAHFCHLCGSEREKRLTITDRSKTSADAAQSTNILDQLGLTLASLVFFLLGLGCMIAALLTGFIYKADTLVDWQAVQIWRVEWLLAACAGMLAGILLKKHRP